MAKYGKWIGGGLGWALGGPLGALLGFAVGSMFDRMQTGEYDYNAQPTQSGDFAASLIVLSAAIMKADGRVLKSELEYVKRFFQQQFGSDKTEESMKILRDVLKREIPLQDICLQIKQYMESPAKLQLLHFLFGISSADGQYHPKEVETIRLISGYIGVSSKDFNSIKAMFVKEIDNAYRILQISPDANEQEIKKAYRNLAIKYHPDKVTHLGEDIQKAAKEKFQKINAAYEEIKKQKGFN